MLFDQGASESGHLLGLRPFRRFDVAFLPRTEADEVAAASLAPPAMRTQRGQHPLPSRAAIVLRIPRSQVEPHALRAARPSDRKTFGPLQEAAATIFATRGHVAPKQRQQPGIGISSVGGTDSCRAALRTIEMERLGHSRSSTLIDRKFLSYTYHCAKRNGTGSGAPTVTLRRRAE